jgi:DNA-binding IclR family transcriptional regulator
MAKGPVGEKGEHQNVARAAWVIDVVSRSKEKGMRLTDVIEETGLGPATIHRLLAGLTAHGFVDHDKERNRYFVGMRLVSWAAAATERYGLAPFVDRSLDDLCVETEDTVYFSLLSGRDSVCVDRREGSYPIKTLTLNVGDRRPLGVGAGSMALLAFQDDAFVTSVLEEDADRRAEFGIATNQLRDEIAETRERDFALVEGRLIPGMSGVAVPIRKADGSAIAAVSVAAVSLRLASERLGTVVDALKREAGRVEMQAADVLNSPFAKRHSTRKGG